MSAEKDRRQTSLFDVFLPSSRTIIKTDKSFAFKRSTRHSGPRSAKETTTTPVFALPTAQASGHTPTQATTKNQSPKKASIKPVIASASPAKLKVRIKPKAAASDENLLGLLSLVDAEIPAAQGKGKEGSAVTVKMDDEENGTAFSAKQEQRLLTMKLEENKMWKDISVELGKPVWLVKQRFRELRSGQNENAPPQQPVAKKPEAPIPPTSGQGNKGKENSPPKAKPGGGKEAQGGAGDKPRPGATYAFPDEDFDWNEVMLVSEIVRHDLREFWLRVASRLFDKTGRRVHPQLLRDKFEGKNLISSELASQFWPTLGTE